MLMLCLKLCLNSKCALPKKINTHPKDGHRKFLGGGGGVLKRKILEAKYDTKLEFPEGRWVQNKNPSGGGGGSMDIF